MVYSVEVCFLPLTFMENSCKVFHYSLGNALLWLRWGKRSTPFSLYRWEIFVLLEIEFHFLFVCTQDAVLAVASDKHAVELYSVTLGQLMTSLEGHTARVKGLALSPDNKLLFSASSDGSIRAWRLTKSLVCWCSSAGGTPSNQDSLNRQPLACIFKVTRSTGENGVIQLQEWLD